METSFQFFFLLVELRDRPFFVTGMHGTIAKEVVGTLKRNTLYVSHALFGDETLKIAVR